METVVSARIDPKFWQGKKVFITGHSGFKGSWLSFWLLEMGALVSGYSLAPETNPNLFSVLNLQDRLARSSFEDISDFQKLSDAIEKAQPDVIFHLAAQPLVRRSYREPIQNFQTNVMGTVNVLEAARKCLSVKVLVNVTTDKVYENPETNQAFSEDQALGGYDPYSASKACSEIVTSSYRRSFLKEQGKAVATARAGNVIGGGDWSEDRLIPDLARAVSTSQRFVIRSPGSVRPWQHVLEPLSGYLILAQKMFSNPADCSEAFNFGPRDEDCLQVQEMARRLIQFWGSEVEIQIQPADLHEAALLKLNSEKAKTTLGWSPRWTVDEALKKTAEWYKEFQAGKSMVEFTRAQIEFFNEPSLVSKESR